MGYNNISSASEFPAGKQSSSKTRWALASFIGRLNYAYKDNYILLLQDVMMVIPAMLRDINGAFSRQ